jgi:uncharacterized membrane protein
VDHYFQAIGGAEYLAGKATSRSQSLDYITDPKYLFRQLDWHTKLAGSGAIGLSIVAVLHSIRRDSSSTRERGIEEAALFIFPSFCQWTIFAQAAYIHDYWVNIQLLGISLLAAMTLQRIQLKQIKLFAILILFLSINMSVYELNYRRLDDYTFDLQEYSLNNIDGNDVVLVDSSIWNIHTMKVILPDDTIHIGNVGNEEHFRTVLDEEKPDYILHGNTSWNGWQIGESLNESGYCHQEIYSRSYWKPYHAWSKC